MTDSTKKDLLSNINFSLLEYANWIKSLDYTSIEKAKSEYLNTVTMLNMKISSITDISELLSLNDSIETLLDKCISDIKTRENSFKIIELNKYIKPITNMLKKIKNESIYEEKENELVTLSNIVDKKLSIQNFTDTLQKKISELYDNISIVQSRLSDIKTKAFFESFERDRKKLIDSANKYTAMLKTFDEYIITAIPQNKLIEQIILNATTNKTTPKSYMNMLESSEYTDLKKQFSNIITASMKHIEKEAKYISTIVNNFLGEIATAFNDKWLCIHTKSVTDISNNDYKILESNLKSTNDTIDSLSSYYGKFLDHIYDNYPKYLTTKIFSNLKSI